MFASDLQLSTVYVTYKKNKKLQEILQVKEKTFSTTNLLP